MGARLWNCGEAVKTRNRNEKNAFTTESQRHRETHFSVFSVSQCLCGELILLRSSRKTKALNAGRGTGTGAGSAFAAALATIPRADATRCEGGAFGDSGCFAGAFGQSGRGRSVRDTGGRTIAG